MVREESGLTGIPLYCGKIRRVTLREVEEIERLACQFRQNRKLMTPPLTFKEMLEARARKLEEAKDNAEIPEAEAQTTLYFDHIFFEYILSSPETTGTLVTAGLYYKCLKVWLGRRSLEEISPAYLQCFRDARIRAGLDSGAVEALLQVV